MIATVVASLILFGQGVPSAGQFEIAERVKDFDRVWLRTTDKSRKLAALPFLTTATAFYRDKQFSEACRELDSATAALNGKQSGSEDAISLRFDPPFVEPRTSAKLRVTWAYTPKTNRTVRVSVGSKTVIATPGRPLVIEVRPEGLNPDILQNPEVGYLMPVLVGAEERSVFLSIIKKPIARLASLKTSKNPEADTLAGFLAAVFNDPDSLQEEVPLIQYLFTAELLDEGRLRLDRADSLPFLEFNNSIFRVAFPRGSKGPLDVVIGLPGPLGTENTYFEAYGHGMAATEAIKRDWAFIGVRNDPNAIQNALEWLRTRRKQPIRRVFLLGHEDGADLALATAKGKTKFEAIAALDPTLTTLSDPPNIPIYFAFGRQTISEQGARSMEGELNGNKNYEVVEMDSSSGIALVPEALSGVYRFFDARAK